MTSTLKVISEVLWNSHLLPSRNGTTCFNDKGFLRQGFESWPSIWEANVQMKNLLVFVREKTFTNLLFRNNKVSFDSTGHKAVLDEEKLRLLNWGTMPLYGWDNSYLLKWRTMPFSMGKGGGVIIKTHE